MRLFRLRRNGKDFGRSRIFEKEDRLRKTIFFRVLFRARSLGRIGGWGFLYDDDLLVVQRVPFHFGTSMPFQAESEIMGEDEVERIEFDPFSGYQVTQEE